MQHTSRLATFNRLFKYLPYAVIVLGAILRIVVYLQNRSLFIDEANIARNIYERNYFALLLPLRYSQYAPPLFLWIIKFFTNLGGYSEFAFRLYALLAGLVSLWLLPQLFKLLGIKNAAVYPLILFATGLVFIRYSSELKQYMPDVMITLLLLLTALKNNISNVSAGKFILMWLVGGSLAIWASMPTVFVLAGICGYYITQVAKSKSYAKLPGLILIFGVWAAQFAFYYFSILKPQVHSSYLQTFHDDYFLFLTPETIKQWRHNARILLYVIGSTGGNWALSLIFHLVCIVWAFIYLLRRDIAKAVLLSLPICCLLLAASLRQFSLLERVILFIMPVLLSLIGVGLQRILDLLPGYFKAIPVVIACICIFNFNALHLLWDKLEVEEMAQNLDYLQQKQIPGDALYVHHIAKPAYLYYINIHPGKFQRTSLIGAHSLKWDTKYDSLAKTMKGRTAMIYSYEEPEKIELQQLAIRQYCNVVDSNLVKGNRVYIYERKSE